MNDDELTLEDELLLQAYLDGELPPEQRQMVAARLAEEPGLTALLQQWRTLQTELDALPQPQLTYDLTGGVLARLAATAPLPATMPDRAWWSLLAVQFTLALLTVLLAWPLWSKVAEWSALHLALPDWAALAQVWRAWWAAWWTPDVWLAEWQKPLMSLSFSLPLTMLLPLAAATAVLWLVTVRLTWRAAQGDLKRLN